MGNTGIPEGNAELLQLGGSNHKDFKKDKQCPL